MGTFVKKKQQEFENISVFLCFVVISAQVHSNLYNHQLLDQEEAGGRLYDVNQQLLQFAATPFPLRHFPLCPVLLERIKLLAQRAYTSRLNAILTR